MDNVGTQVADYSSSYKTSHGSGPDIFECKYLSNSVRHSVFL